LIAWLIAGPAVANDYVAKLQAALASPGVEPAVAALHAEAHAAGEASAFWQGFGAVFMTTAPATHRQIEAWRAEAPESALAMTAEAAARIHVGELRRGEDIAAWVAPEDMEDFRREVGLSAELVTAAIANDSRMVLAYFLAFELMKVGAMEAGPDALLETLLPIYPEPVALWHAALVYDPPWGGSMEQMLAVCAAFADRLPDYDAEACGIDLILRNPRDRASVVTAYEALEARDEPWLDDTRYHALLNVGARPDQMAERANWAIEVHRARLADDIDPAEWLAQAERLASWSGNPLYALEAAERLQPFLDRWLARDPYNTRSLVRLINTLRLLGRGRSEDERARLRELWLRAMVHGSRKPEHWVFGAQVMAGWPDIAGELPYLENAVATSPTPGFHLGCMLRTLTDDEAVLRSNAGLDRGATGPEADAARAEIALAECPKARAARLMHAACASRAERGEPYCQRDSREYAQVGPILAALERGEICPELATAPLEMLAYDELRPVPELEAFLSTVEPGFR
jgi:hypothetical protein